MVDNSSSNSNNNSSSSGRINDDQQRRQSETTSELTTAKKEEVLSNKQLPGVENSSRNVAGTTNKGNAEEFTFEELAKATDNFRPDFFVGEGGFGKVYRGYLQRINQDVAIKRLDLKGIQGVREFAVEAMTLSLADHPNLVKLIGSCAEGDQRLLVYEYMPLGNLESHLFDLPSNQQPLDWNTRMKIAAAAANGLEYLHLKMNPPVIYRDLKCSNILLDEGYHTKLSDFGLAKVGPSGDDTHVSTRVMGTYGYCAPEYAKTGQLTFKSDVYSYGVVMLELITGKRAMDERRGREHENIADWARPMFKDRRNFPAMADPLLNGQYPMRGLYQALAIAAMCLQETPVKRPCVSEVVTAINFIASQKFEPAGNTSASSSSSQKEDQGHGKTSDAGGNSQFYTSYSKTRSPLYIGMTKVSLGEQD
ncbi:hypothetical protein ACFE04_015289 [Oxalis oulophora]